MRARVKTSFPGVEDGQVYPREIAVDEILTGDLAREAIAGGFAEPVDEAKEAKAAAKRAADEAEAQARAAQAAAGKRLADLKAIATTAKVDLGKAETIEEIEAALKAAGVEIPA